MTERKIHLERVEKNKNIGQTCGVGNVWDGKEWKGKEEGKNEVSISIERTKVERMYNLR